MKKEKILSVILLILVSTMVFAFAANEYWRPCLAFPSDWVAYPMYIVSSDALDTPPGFFPTQIRAAYNLPSTGGQGTIAIIDAYDNPTVVNDLNVFSNQFGLPTITSANFEKHMMAPSVSFDSNWALEISLDVQWAHAIAPNAKILLVEAVDALGGNLLDAVDYARNRADVVAISMSWGGPEFSGESAYDPHFISPYGASFFASSGDNGTGVNWHAVSSNVVGVGGTTLTFANGIVSSETAWQGGGGGLSAFEPEPAYQVTYGVPGANGQRAVPDVSYYADPVPGVPVYTSFSGMPVGWSAVGGTSAGAPQWAAIHSIGQTATNNNFYRIAGSAFYHSYFRDITAGSNGNPALPDYDYVTGLGSPLTTLYDLPPSNPTLSGPTTVYRNVWYTYTTNSVTDPEEDQIRYHLNATGPGNPYQNTTIWVNSGTPMSWNLMWEPTDNPGTYLLQAWVEDSYGMLSSMGSLSVTNGRPTSKRSISTFRSHHLLCLFHVVLSVHELLIHCERCRSRRGQHKLHLPVLDLACNHDGRQHHRWSLCFRRKCNRVIRLDETWSSPRSCICNGQLRIKLRIWLRHASQCAPE
jgi:subtilase family serine protease